MSSSADTQRNELATIQEEANNTANKQVMDVNVTNPNTTNSLHEPNQNGTSLPAHNNGDLGETNVNKQHHSRSNSINKDISVDVNQDTVQLNTKEGFKDPISRTNFGLFAYVPECFRNICLTPYGILFFLCWASTMQVHLKSI